MNMHLHLQARVAGSALFVGAALAASAYAATLFTSESSFLPELQPGYYLEDFSGYSVTYDNVPSPQSFSGGSEPFNYSILSSSGDDLYVISPAGVGKSLSVLNSEDNLIVSFTGSDVTAVGGRFMMTDYDGNLTSGTVTVRLSDGTVVTVTSPGSNPDDLFRGFTSTTPIASLTVVGTGNPAEEKWPALSHLYVGKVVPEPGTLALGLIGLAVIVGWRRLARH